MSLSAINRLFESLDRLGPGDDETTRAALAACVPLPERPYVLDLGCGTGASAIVLADALRSTVIGIDIHPPFLHRLRARAAEKELGDFVDTRAANFNALPFAPASVDLLWSEGALYLPGFREGLSAWKPLLREGGFLCASHFTWATRVPPRPARAYWEARAKDLATEEENCAVAESVGFRVVDTLRLPQRGWEAYYEPLAERVAAIEESGYSERGMEALLASTREEIAMWKAHGRSWNYVFYVLQPS